MPSIQPSHRLYLYQLLAREVGFGRQVGLARVGEVLADDGLAPADLGCADVRALCDALDGMVRVTAFKKGQVFATLLPVEEYDRALMRLEAGKGATGERGATGAKSFKRKKGARDLRPVRPRHVPTEAERAAVEAAAAATAAAAEAAVATTAAAAEAASKPEPEGVEIAPMPKLASEVGDAAVPEEPLPADEPQAETPAEMPAPGGPERAPELGVAVASEAAPVFAPDAATEPAAGPESAATSEPKVEPAPDPTPSLAAEPPAHEPSIRLQITYVPEPEPAPEPDEGPETPTETAPEPEPTPKAAPKPTPAPRLQPHRGLPQDFRAEVLVPSDMLLALYEVLPPDADPLSVLDEDLRVARSTGATEGDRAQASFPLRYLRASGEPVRVVLRRVARPAPGAGATSAKRWVVAAVEADAPETVSLAGLDETLRGAWAAFAQVPARRRPAGPMTPCDLGPVTTPDPERTLAQTVGLGRWDELLPRLAALMPPEDWGSDLHVLRECVAMGFCRVVAQGALATSADGTCAAFDLGLVSAAGEPVRALLLATGTDIPWALDDLVAAAGPVGPAALDPAPPRYLRSFAEVAFDPALPAPPLAARAALERDPRLAAPAYDALRDRVVLLVPDAASPADASAAMTLVPSPDGYALGPTIGLEAARTCARVVSATLPAWLRAH